RQEADIKYPARLAELRQRRDEGIARAEEHYPPRIKALDEKYEQDTRQLQETYRATKEATKREYDQTWGSLIRNWTEGLARVSGVVNEVNEEASRRFLDWSNTSLDHWKPPVEVPPGLPLGTFAVDLSEFPNGVPTDARLKDAGP